MQKLMNTLKYITRDNLGYNYYPETMMEILFFTTNEKSQVCSKAKVTLIVFFNYKSVVQHEYIPLTYISIYMY